MKRMRVWRVHTWTTWHFTFPSLHLAIKPTILFTPLADSHSLWNSSHISFKMASFSFPTPMGVCVVFLMVGLVMSSSSTSRFDEFFQPSWALDHFLYEGEVLRMKLDTNSGINYFILSDHQFINLEALLWWLYVVGICRCWFRIEEQIHVWESHRSDQACRGWLCWHCYCVLCELLASLPPVNHHVAIIQEKQII